MRQERFEAERRREELVKRAKQLQGKSQNKRNQGTLTSTLTHGECCVFVCDVVLPQETFVVQSFILKLHTSLDKSHAHWITARDVWKKKYFEEKKKTPPLEEQCTKLRQELDQLHRKIMSTLESKTEREGRRQPPDKPSTQVRASTTHFQFASKFWDLYV